jgi:hypothetical protein
MSQLELYAVLRSLGVEDDKAKAAVEDSGLVTKEFLKAEVADLKADLTWRIVLAMGAQIAIFSAIVAALKFVK